MAKNVVLIVLFVLMGMFTVGFVLFMVLGTRSASDGPICYENFAKNHEEAIVIHRRKWNYVLANKERSENPSFAIVRR